MKLNKKIISICIIVIVLFVIFIFKIYHRYAILKQIRDSVIYFNNCNNYKIVDYDKTVYYKDGIIKEVYNNENRLIWSDGEFTYYLLNDNHCLKKKAENCIEGKRLIFDMLDFQELTNAKLLVLSLDIFSIKISENIFYNNNKSISKGVIMLKINKDKILYCDMDTKLPLFYKTENEEVYYSNNITLNTVTDEDIVLNFNNYEIFNTEEINTESKTDTEITNSLYQQKIL